MKFPLKNGVFFKNQGKAKREMMAELGIATPSFVRFYSGQHNKQRIHRA